MNYRSFGDLAQCIRENLHRIPSDVDLVVGVPRSGLLAANLIALGLNLKITDLRGYLGNVVLPPDNLRQSRFPDMHYAQQAKHVLVVEDSVLSGGSMTRVRAEIDAGAKTNKVTYCAVYAAREACDSADVVFEVVPAPRAFEWNLMHRELLGQCCLDIDGVLCPDPDEVENDDGETYLRFLEETVCLVRPSNTLGHLVSARLERYRPQTERWLAKNGIRYQNLHLLDLPDGETRRRTKAHAPFKARIYREASDSVLFIESDPGQAEQIAHLSGKPVLCHTTQQMFQPGMTPARVAYQGRRFGAGVLRGLRRLVARR